MWVVARSTNAPLPIGFGDLGEVPPRPPSADGRDEMVDPAEFVFYLAGGFAGAGESGVVVHQQVAVPTGRRTERFA